MNRKFNKTIKILVILAVLLGCFSIPIYAETNSKTPVEKHGKLRLNDSNIVDKNGDKFQLRGISTHGIAWFPDYVNQEAFNYMRDEWKINVIRLAMYSDPNAGYSENTKAKVKEGVEYAKNAGLYVIIDWHILSDGNPNIYKDEAIKFFKEMSTLYKDYDNIIYEICNEPNGDVIWDRDVKPYAEEVISEIRKIDPKTIIIVGTPTWSQDVDIAAQNPIIGYDNIMYSLHFYAATHKEYLRDKLSQALNSNLPVFVTEFGVCDASGNGSLDLNESDIWINMLDENNISYVCWNLSNKNESSALLNSSTSKLTGWTLDELSEGGKWLVNKLKEYKDETSTNNDNKAAISNEARINNTTGESSNSLVLEESVNKQPIQNTTGETPVVPIIVVSIIGISIIIAFVILRKRK